MQSVTQAEPPPPAPPASSGSSKVALLVGMIIAGLFVGGAGAALLVWHYAVPSPSSSRVVSAPSPNVVLAVRELARLETANYHMERVVELSDEQTHLFGLIQSKDALMLVAVGDVVAGIDLQKLRDEDVQADWTTHTIRIEPPAPVVFSANLDNTRTHVETRSTDRLADRREDLEGLARREAEAKLRSAAIEAGILDRARGGGERALESLLHSLGFEQVQISWREP
jgi:hypothetical protein